jgi:hypothetical protein
MAAPDSRWDAARVGALACRCGLGVAGSPSVWGDEAATISVATRSPGLLWQILGQAESAGSMTSIRERQQEKPADNRSALDSVLELWQLRRYLRALHLSKERMLLYRGTAVALTLWGLAYMYVVIYVIPNGIYWLSYYAVNYDHGFVRRGLGGEIIGIFPARDYFLIARTLMTASVALYVVALVILVRHIVFRGQKAERRVVVGLLIPVLPCSISFAFMGPRPEFFAASAFLIFVVLLTRLKSSRSIVVSSAAYGLVIAVMTFVHEAIALEFALGSILAIAVLAPVEARARRRLCSALAIGPGLLALGVVALFGRHDLAPQICRSIPHELMPNTFKVPSGKVMDYVTGHFQSVSDYHQWVCQHIVPYFDQTISNATRTVGGVGLFALVAGFVYGLLVCAFTIWLISYCTAVPWRKFLSSVRGGLLVPALALSMMTVLFATGVDWIRWWTIILINIAVVYLLFAADRPEIETPVTRRQLKVLIAIGIFLACVPLAGRAGWGPGFEASSTGKTAHSKTPLAPTSTATTNAPHHSPESG